MKIRKCTVRPHRRKGRVVRGYVRNVPLKFYDLRGRKAFTTDQYGFKIKSGRRFAVAKTPSGAFAYRIAGSK